MAREFEQVLASGRLTNGAHVAELEQAVAEYTGARYAVAVASCTVGLLLVLRTIDHRSQGRRRTETVIPGFTFSATAHAAAWNGMEPVFADCRADTFNVDPGHVRRVASDRTAAIVATDVFGNPADRQELARIAAEKGAELVIDAAHSLGSKYAGLPLGGAALAQVFSLSPTKVVTAGEGGLIITDDEGFYAELRRARNYGQDPDYDSKYPGLNGRMSELHAIVGRASLGRIEEFIEVRNDYAALYREELSGLPGVSFQEVALGNRSTFKDFSVLIDEAVFGLSRDRLADALVAENIETKPYFFPPVHRQTAYRRSEWGGLSVTDRVAAQALSLPLSTRMASEDVQGVADAITAIHDFAAQIGPSRT